MLAAEPKDTQQAKIVVADDDHDIINLLRYILEREGYSLVTGYNGQEALSLIESEKPDLVILDIMMPKLDGLSVCRRIRQNPMLRDTPILMLTALGDEEHEVTGLDSGADAYLSKPVAPRRLLSHVRALLRRMSSEKNAFDAPLTILRIADLVVDRNRYIIRRDQNGHSVEIELPRREFELLYFMASHPGRVFTRQELLNQVWGTNVFVMDRTIDVHISKIREKLDSGYIETVKGVGYKFRA